MRYIILKSKSVFDLEKVVNEHLKNGWLAQGGIDYDSYHELYMQTMIKGE